MKRFKWTEIAGLLIAVLMLIIWLSVMLTDSKTIGSKFIIILAAIIILYALVEWYSYVRTSQRLRSYILKEFDNSILLVKELKKRLAKFEYKYNITRINKGNLSKIEKEMEDIHKILDWLDNDLEKVFKKERGDL